MKKLFFILSIITLWSCQEKVVFEINGRVGNGEKKKIYLEKQHVSGTEIIDSAIISNENRFNFEAEISQPEFYVLRFENGKAITLLAEPKEDILINIEGDKSDDSYQVFSSKGSILIKELIDTLNYNKYRLDSIRVVMRENIDNESKIKELEQELKSVIKDQRKYSANFIMKNATSLSSYFALYQKIDKSNYTLNENSDINFVKIVASSMRALYPEHEFTKSILANLKTLQSKLSNIQITNLIKESGDNFPDIELPNQYGKSSKLSDLKGKFIILNFWASQNGLSRKYNIGLKKTYSKYKNKGLEIYQVSADNNKELWKASVKADGLTWINVCDPKTQSAKALQMYNVKQIPTNYLIDKNGNIVGKNLYGHLLDEKLEELL
ncbi:MAG: redoxin domain-containing protein [Marinifilaceae bacterium]|jgi:peroxiredoxin|nr:redoxin domain-containing protein [Marinifilaceae bacterium]